MKTINPQIKKLNAPKHKTYEEMIPRHIVVKLLKITYLKNKKTKNKTLEVPGWLSWLSVQLLISAQVAVSHFMSLSPASDSGLTVQSLLGIFLSPSLSLPLP